jgi:hypothetical protein
MENFTDIVIKRPVGMKEFFYRYGYKITDNRHIEIAIPAKRI